MVQPGPTRLDSVESVDLNKQDAEDMVDKIVKHEVEKITLMVNYVPV